MTWLVQVDVCSCIALVGRVVGWGAFGILAGMACVRRAILHVKSGRRQSGPSQTPHQTERDERCISATEITRANETAHEFYSTVFNWKFEGTPSDPKQAEEVRQFDFNPDMFLSGGIQRVPEPTGTLATGRGGVCFYWLVENAEKIGDVTEKAGGKMLSSTEKEGEGGL
ncbi:hypothetical protein B0T24DRAFT_587277 [Lasiosphaeria ovina]|uniref:Uncharacterized protein n=1 Tax=Lasiosphaeria ovina TaxID=92902 RepID=A0AAE0NJ82_9PEZI|nr:hypothetical protein B0T24DRAFT_587277 [Lasiosphaeria ovina]